MWLQISARFAMLHAILQVRSNSKTCIQHKLKPPDVRFEIEIIATAYVYTDKCQVLCGNDHTASFLSYVHFVNEGHYVDFRPQVGLYNHTLPRAQKKAFVWPNF